MNKAEVLASHPSNSPSFSSASFKSISNVRHYFLFCPLPPKTAFHTAISCALAQLVVYADTAHDTCWQQPAHCLCYVRELSCHAHQPEAAQASAPPPAHCHPPKLDCLWFSVAQQLATPLAYRRALQEALLPSVYHHQAGYKCCH
eukprot:1159798-Pelagomonas_calceolata.AAC.5